SVPSLDVIGLARAGPDVAGRGPHEPAERLLLHDVRAPAGDPGAREHRREHVRGYLGEVEDHGRPELDVGREYPVRAAGVQLLQGRLLQRLGRLVPWGAE